MLTYINIYTYNASEYSWSLIDKKTKYGDGDDR